MAIFDDDVGFFKNTVDNVDQEKKPEPQQQAADAIREGIEGATGIIEEGVGTARGDLQPFTDAGVAALPGIQENLQGIQSLVTDPTAQTDFIQNNPFFDALADDAQRRIFNQGSATGKRFAGGTAEALQNSIMLLGPELLNQNISQRSNLVTQGQTLANMGAGTATNQANVSTQGALTLADLNVRGRETEAAGILGLENTRRADKAAKRSDTLGLVGTGITAGALAYGLSDRRFKTDIKPLGESNGIPYYLFKYKGSDDVQIGTMADDVEHIPGAVIERNGVKFVNYGVL